MKHLFVAALCALALASGSAAALAQASHNDGSVGFHYAAAPIGTRWWFAGQKVGIDLGFGYSQTPRPSDTSKKLNTWRIDAGLPLVLKSWEGVHVLFRPGVRYESAEEELANGLGGFSIESNKTLDVQAELEAEVFLRDNVSVSASEGVVVENFNPAAAGAKTTTNVFTEGRNFTTIGFHVYFLGGSK